MLLAKIVADITDLPPYSLNNYISAPYCRSSFDLCTPNDLVKVTNPTIANDIRAHYKVKQFEYFT